jgi:hypothetical protein
MCNRKATEAALAALGIKTEAELNEAIRNLKPINLSSMTESRERERKAS